MYTVRRDSRFDIVKEDGKAYFDISANKTADGWELFYRIPLEFIQLFYPDYRFDRDITANMYKCGNRTVKKHFIAWAAIYEDTPNFHLPEYFGRMSFER